MSVKKRYWGSCAVQSHLYSYWCSQSVCPCSVRISCPHCTDHNTWNILAWVGSQYSWCRRDICHIDFSTWFSPARCRPTFRQLLSPVPTVIPVGGSSLSGSVCVSFSSNLRSYGSHSVRICAVISSSTTLKLATWLDRLRLASKICPWRLGYAPWNFSFVTKLWRQPSLFSFLTTVLVSSLPAAGDSMPIDGNHWIFN